MKIINIFIILTFLLLKFVTTIIVRFLLLKIVTILSVNSVNSVSPLLIDLTVNLLLNFCIDMIYSSCYGHSSCFFLNFNFSVLHL